MVNTPAATADSPNGGNDHEAAESNAGQSGEGTHRAVRKEGEERRARSADHPVLSSGSHTVECGRRRSSGLRAVSPTCGPAGTQEQIPAPARPGSARRPARARKRGRRPAGRSCPVSEPPRPGPPGRGDTRSGPTHPDPRPRPGMRPGWPRSREDGPPTGDVIADQEHRAGRDQTHRQPEKQPTGRSPGGATGHYIDEGSTRSTPRA